MKANCFKKTVKMLHFDEFCKDANNLIIFAKKVVTESKDELQFPCKMISMTA